MKTSIFSALTLSFAVALGTIGLSAPPSLSQPGPGERGFWCDTSSGLPTTTYKNSQGGYEPWIRWVSNYFIGSGYDPVTRCREVSARLETYRRNQQLKFITVGYMNRQPVICTASQVNGRCEGLIFTLKPGQDAVRTLHTFLAWREGQAATPSLYESGEMPYIDVRDRIEEGLPETAMPAATNAPVEETEALETNMETEGDSSSEESGGLREL